MNCPKCGKPMEEGERFPGLWICPDYKTPINDEPPWQFICTGMHLTDQGMHDLQREMLRLMAKQN